MAAANEDERQRWNDKRWAELWPKRERLTSTITPVLLGALALQRGDRLLDVGCGAGAATLSAAKLVGDEGLIVGADISAPLAELARRRAVDAGAHNVEFQVVDMQTQPVTGAPFTVAMSQFGVMFFDEPVVAFGNIRAQLAAGGRLGFACWQAAAKNPWLLGAALADLWPAPAPPLPGKSAAGPFALADPARIRTILETAGFIDIDVAPHEMSVELPEDAVTDDDDAMFKGIAAERVPAARAAVQRHLEQFRLASGLSRYPIAYQVATARNPG